MPEEKQEINELKKQAALSDDNSVLQEQINKLYIQIDKYQQQARKEEIYLRRR